jgi:hypothetical protein
MPGKRGVDRDVRSWSRPDAVDVAPIVHFLMPTAGPRRAVHPAENGKETDMEAQHGVTPSVGTKAHKAARPMRVVIADDGCNWLCDSDVDESQDLRKQGCWRCGDLAFTRND